MRLSVNKCNLFRTEMVKRQGGRCAICKVKFSKSQVPCQDHDHSTGHLRGALCRVCNRAEGKIRTAALACKRDGTTDDWLTAYVEYMVHYSEPKTKALHHSHRTKREKMDAANRKAREKRAKAKAKALL